MLPIAGQTAKPIGLNFFVDTRIRKLKKIISNLFPINVKTAKPIGPKFFVESRVTPGPREGFWMIKFSYIYIDIQLLNNSVFRFHRFLLLCNCNYFYASLGDAMFNVDLCIHLSFLIPNLFDEYLL